jgi:GldM C-terminal domain
MKKLVLIFSLINMFIFTANAQDAVIAVEKMNVFYMGVDNPISIAVPNVSSDKLKVTGENVESINKQSDGHYNVRVARPGEVTIIVEANGQISKKKFRAKQIPDPIPMISSIPYSSHRYGEKVNINNFKNSEGIVAQIMNFDFSAFCSVQSFEIIISPQKGEIFRKTVLGPAFSEEIKKRFQMLQVGDTVTFLDIKSRCPGDEIARNLGSLSYVMQ